MGHRRGEERQQDKRDSFTLSDRYSAVWKEAQKSAACEGQHLKVTLEKENTAEDTVVEGWKKESLYLSVILHLIYETSLCYICDSPDDL